MIILESSGQSRGPQPTKTPQLSTMARSVTRDSSVSEAGFSSQDESSPEPIPPSELVKGLQKLSENVQNKTHSLATTNGDSETSQAFLQATKDIFDHGTQFSVFNVITAFTNQWIPQQVFLWKVNRILTFINSFPSFSSLASLPVKQDRVIARRKT